VLLVSADSPASTPLHISAIRATVHPNDLTLYFVPGCNWISSAPSLVENSVRRVHIARDRAVLYGDYFALGIDCFDPPKEGYVPRRWLPRLSPRQ